MAEFKNTTIDDTGFLELPSGTSAQRPSNPQQGMIRYNTDDQIVEVYNGTEWGPLVEIPIDAEGGTESEVTINGQDYKIHAFTSTGNSTFTVNSIGTLGGEIDVLVVAGGGGGGGTENGNDGGGGGGAGEVAFLPAVSLSPGAFNVVVGSGGTGTPPDDGRGGYSFPSSAFGGDTTFDGTTVLGGGAGGVANGIGGDGGSGGGAGGGGAGVIVGPGGGGDAIGNFEGSDGGDMQDDSPFTGGGGGGATQPGVVGSIGSSSTDSNTQAGGGDGLDVSATFGTQFGENGVFGGGGAGGSSNSISHSFQGGLGGGADAPPSNNAEDGFNGQINTGGGASGGSNGDSSGGDGGSGIVLIRYRI